MSTLATTRRNRAMRCVHAIAVLAIGVGFQSAHAFDGIHQSAASNAHDRARTAPTDDLTDATGKIRKSPVLGPEAPDGTMGGMIPSAVPGWTPHPSDAKDAYVYVPGTGWRLGDTRQERLDNAGSQ